MVMESNELLTVYPVRTK